MKVRSGFTKEMEQKKEKWKLNYGLKSWEELYRIARRENKIYGFTALAKILSDLTAPFYCYMMRYLVYIHSADLKELAKACKGKAADGTPVYLPETENETGTDDANAWQDALADELIRVIRSGEDSLLLEELVSLVFEDFKDNFCAPETKTMMERNERRTAEQGAERASGKRAGGADPARAARGGRKRQDCVYGSINYSQIEQPLYWNRQKLKQILTAETIRDREFFMLAFGLNMSYEDVETFLQKALRRGKLNVWDREEMLIRLAFCCASEDKIGFYNRALLYYREVEPEPGKISSERTAQRATAVIENRITQLERELDETLEVLGEEEETFEAVKVFLAEHKYLTGREEGAVRTAARVCRKLIERIEENCADDIRSFTESFREGGKRARGSVQVYYDPRKGVRIPKGTKFLQRTKTEGKEQTVVFESTREVQAEATDRVAVELEVVCTKDAGSGKKAEELYGYVPANRTFRLEGGSAEAAAAFFEISNQSVFKTKVRIEEYSVQTSSKGSAVERKVRNSIRGKLYAQCKCGTVIPEGTVFACEDKNYPYFYEYRTKQKKEKTIFCETYVNVPVEGPEDGTEATKNTIHEIEDVRDGIVRITNTKIGRTGAAQEEKAVSGESPLYRYLYRVQTDGEGAEHSFLHMKLLEHVLEPTRIPATRLNGLKAMTQTPCRNDVLTLAALAEMSEMELETGDGRWSREERGEWFDAFYQTVNSCLQECGFYPLYLGNAYDCLLAYLVTSSEPLNAFRNLWGEYAGLQQKKERKEV